MKKNILSLLFIVAIVAISRSQSAPSPTYVGAGPDMYTFPNVTTQLRAMGGLTYSWSPGAGLSDSTIADPLVDVSDTTMYILTMGLDSGRYLIDTVMVYVINYPSGASASCSNLVSNWSFDVGNCATNTQGIIATGWVSGNQGGTPDWASTCFGTGGWAGLPQNNWTSLFLSPHSGTGIQGVISYDNNVVTSGVEYVQQHLTCPLLAGQTYTLSFWATHANRAKFTCGQVGMLLSPTRPYPTGWNPITSTPQLSGTVSNSTSWNNFTTVFTPTVNMGWLTLGDFGLPLSGCSAGSGNWDNDFNYYDDITITPIAPVITTTAVTACSGMPFQLCASGGANYTWTDINGTVGTGSCVTITAPTVTATTVFGYTVTTTLSCPSSCTLTTATTVTVNPPPTITVNSASICPSASVTLTASGGVTYTWSPGTGLSSTNGSTVTASPGSTTVYTVSGTNSNGCVGSATSTVTVYSPPTIIASNTTICNGSSAVLTASGASTYTWAPGGMTGATVTVTPTSTQVYTITGTSLQGCIGTKTVQVTVNPKPTLAPTATPSVICASTTTNTTALNVSGASTYTWTAAGSSTLSCTACTAPTATLSGYSSFTFTVIGTASTTCTNSAVVTVTVNPKPTVTVNSPTICPGTVTTLTASGASTYTWSANAGSATTSTVNVSPSTTTVYTVTGTGANGCTNTATSTVTTKPAPTVPVITGTLCVGVTGTLTASSGAGYTYTWSPTTGTNSTSCGPCATTTVTNPSGVYTVVATNTATTCSVSNTYTTNALPTVSIATAPTNSYCAYSPTTVTLTASGANTYSWSTTATTATITATPTVTTSYTVTGTASSGCENTTTATITVVPAPTISPSVTPNPVCQGLTATLTATGASTYTWNPGSLTGSSVSVSPSSTQTYTVTGTASTCTASATITLSVTPAPTLTVSSTTWSSCNYTSPSNNTICPGGSATLTATGVTNYTWNPGGATTNTVAVSPSSTTIYTVTGNNGSCNGTNTVSITVSTCNCTGTTVSSWTNSAISGGPYVSNGTVTVSGNVVLNSTTIAMGPLALIIVPSGASLTVRGSHLYACYNMWQGIQVAPGGTVTVIQNSLIEDANVAIDNNPTNTVQTGTPPMVSINGAVFNCNQVGVRQAYYQDGTTTNYGSNNTSINDGVFTCRCGIPFPVTTSALKTYTNTVTGNTNPNTPDLSDFYTVGNYTVTNMKVPNQTLPPYEGVELTNSGYATVMNCNSGNPLPYTYSIGGSSLVLFDNHCYGINATNTSLRDTNCAFQNPRYYPQGFLHVLSLGGYGINAVNTLPDHYNGLHVHNSRFIDMVRAVNCTNYFDHEISNNTMWSQQVIVPVGSGATTSPPHGSYGVICSSPRFCKAEMNNNNIANINNVLVFNATNTSGYVTGGNGEWVGPVSVISNTLTPQFTSSSYSNKYIGTGISIGNSILPASGNTGVANGNATQVAASRNYISGAFNGILFSNHQFQEVRDELNTIVMQYQPTLLSTESTQYGIQHSYCMNGFSASTYGDDVYNNTITGTFATNYTFTSSNQAGFEPKKGIWVNYSANHYVTCNTVSHAGRGFEFQGGTQSPMYWAKNVMTHDGEAYTLTSGAIIGTQSTTASGVGYANDNQWTSTTISFADTYVDAASTAVSSVLWLQSNSGVYGPVSHQGGGTRYSYFPAYLVQPKSATPYACGTPPTRIAHHESGTETERDGQSSPPSYDISLLEKVVQDSIDYGAYYDQNSYINKNMVYRLVRSNASLINSSPVLANFLNNNSNSSWALMCQIEDSLAAMNLSYASSLVSSFSPSNLIEQNYKRYYQMYINGAQGNFTAQDTADLEILASSCPMINGTVVYQARALHMGYYNDFKNYEDNCPQMGGNTEKNTGVNLKKGASLTVYPNPTNEKVYISGFAKTDKTINVEVSDITGKTVLKQSVASNNGLIELSLPFNNGVYFIKVIGNSGNAQVEKVIINR